MQRLVWGVVATALGACFGTMVLESDAQAAGFATQKFGGEEGNPVTTNPTALYYNPAGIGFTEGIHLYFDQQIALRHATYTHELGPGDPTTAPANLGNVGEAHLFNVFSGPTIAGTMKIGNLALGAGVFVPFAGREHWAQNPSAASTQDPLAVDGVQRWHSVDGSLTFLYATAGAAYKLGPLSIGVTGNFIQSWIELSKSQNLGGQELPNSASEGTATINVKGMNGSFGAGAMLEAIPEHLWLGASYQAQPGLGQQSLKGTFSLTSPTPGNSLPTQKATLTESLPDIFRGGIRFRASRSFELRAFGDYTRWSKLSTQCVVLQGYPCIVYKDGSDATGAGAVLANFRRAWKDTYGGRIGVSYWTSPDVELFAGGGYETGATPNSTLAPDIADANNYQGTLGGRFFVAHYLYLAASYTHIQYENRDNTGQSTYATYKGPTQQGDAGGVYTQWVGIFDLNLEKQF
jgi:long-chain fatty acid transport protein